MGLVDYSDSEASDVDETASVPAATPKVQPLKPTFQKVTNPTEPRKIKVDLPALQHEEDVAPENGPPTKKARTAGTFGGFNSFLPAPKRTVAPSAPKAGVSLKTSSEAAFSRAPLPSRIEDERDYDEIKAAAEVDPIEKTTETKSEEPKTVGKATKFKPLSVANKKKKPLAKKPIPMADDLKGEAIKSSAAQSEKESAQAREATPPKPKRSLFSVPQEEARVETAANGAYEPIIRDHQPATDGLNEPTSTHLPSAAPAPNPNSLQSLTADLNLTAAQQRQLFGRNGKTGDVNIAHFNMENEYAANERLREAGEVMEHRAVKAIAPGKHSLQQLVNNARSQQEAMEDKWAEGRRDRGEGGAKYGWGR